MSQVTLPCDKDLARTLSGLLGKDVKVKAVPQGKQNDPKDLFFGIYDDGANTLAAAWISDLPISASLAAALTLIPAGVVKEVIKTNQLPAELAENVREVVNITANSFGGQRVRLIHFYTPGQSPSADAAAFVQRATNRLDLQAEVAGYAAGRISLFVA